MSTSTIATEMVGSFPRPRSAPFVSPQFLVIQEMLATLETLTTAGQRHMMNKVVAFIATEAPRALSGTSQRNHAALIQLIEDLQHEAARMAPDQATFRHRAESLLALVGAAAQ